MELIEKKRSVTKKKGRENEIENNGKERERHEQVEVINKGEQQREEGIDKEE